MNALRASDRVKPSVKEKYDVELLDHYELAQGGYLTHLGILCLGQRHQRAQMTSAPVIQFIKYDEHGQKVNKLVWDDHTLNPMELIEAVWLEVPDFRERYELPDGLYRQNVPAFDEVVDRGSISAVTYPPPIEVSAESPISIIFRILRKCIPQFGKLVGVEVKAGATVKDG